MGKLLYENLTEQVIGIAFKVYNALGYGVRELYIHRAMAQEFVAAGIAFSHEVSVPLTYNGERIGRYQLDFIVAGTIVVEIKVTPFVKHIHVKQVLEYLRTTEKRIALLIFFTQHGIKVKRILLPEDRIGIRSSSAQSAQ